MAANIFCASASARYSSTYFIASSVGLGYLELSELADLTQILEHLLRFHLVDPGDREADMDDDMVADLGVRHVRHAYFLGDAAEVDAAHSHAERRRVEAHYLAGNSQTHDQSRRLRSVVAQPGRGDEGLAERYAAIGRGHLPVLQDLETALPERTACMRCEQPVLEAAAAECHTLAVGQVRQRSQRVRHAVVHACSDDFHRNTVTSVPEQCAHQ